MMPQQVKRIVAMVAALMVVTSLVAGVMTMSAVATPTDGQVPQRAVSEQVGENETFTVPISGDVASSSDAHKPCALCSVEHTASVNEETNTHIFDQRVSSEVGAVAASAYTLQESKNWTAKSDGLMNVSETYEVTGRVYQARNGGRLDGGATRAVVLTQVVVIDRTADEWVAQKNVTEHDLLTPTPLDVALETLLKALEFVIGSHLSKVPFIDEGGGGFLADVILGTAEDMLDVDENSTSLDKTRTVEFTFDAKKGHKYQLGHVTYVVSGGAETLGKNVEIDSHVESTVKSVEVTRNAEGPEDPEKSIVEIIASYDESHDPKRVNFFEIRAAVIWWSLNQPVPGTDGELISFAAMRKLIILWTTGQTL